MLNSRDINLLREDVAANCRIWLDLCKAEGLNPLVVSTVRDDEYQASLYEQGRTRPGGVVTNSKTPTFHWNKAGLAFDFCKNVKGQEYSDNAFFDKCAAIAKRMGFEWGGDWKSFVDKPHLQWSGADKSLTGAQIRAGKRPATMPLYQTQPEKTKEDEEEMITQEQFNVMLAESNAQQALKPVNDWAKTAWNKAVAAGIFDGTAPQRAITREQTAVVLDRLGLIK